MTSPDAIHDPAHITHAEAQRDAQFYHRAQRIAVDLWDERDETGRLRDLLPYEEAFLTTVHQIGQDYVRVCGDAKRAFGPDSKTALAVEFTARARRAERYAAALERYEAQKEAFWNAALE